MLTTGGSFHLVKEEKLDFHQTIRSNTCWRGTCCSPAKKIEAPALIIIVCDVSGVAVDSSPNHYCAIVVITPRLNLPALYAEAIELIPTRKWQLVMWGKMDFAVLRYCEGPRDNTVDTIKRRLNRCSCEMCSAWIKGLLIGSQLPTALLRTCFTACLQESDNTFSLIYFDELRSYLRSDFLRSNLIFYFLGGFGNK